MANLRAGMVSNIEPVNEENKSLSYETFAMPAKFEPTGEILQVKVIRSGGRWYNELIGQIIDVIQSDFDTLFAVDYQDEKTDWIKHILFITDIEFIN